MKGYLMYNDNFYPSTTEDDFNSAAEYSEYDSEPYGSDEWLNSQETTPILPLPEDVTAAFIMCNPRMPSLTY